MVIDSIQGGPLQLPFQAWPMLMAPAYGRGEPLAPQGLIGPTMGGFGSLLPWPAMPMVGPWGGQPVYLGGPLASQGLIGSTVGGLGGPWAAPATPAPIPGTLGGPWAPQAVVAPFQITPAVEQQAVIALMRDVTAGPIRKLHDYLDAHSQKYSQLAPGIPVVQQAAKAFGAQDYAQALFQIYQAYRYISALRASIPDLPGL